MARPENVSRQQKNKSLLPMETAFNRTGGDVLRQYGDGRRRGFGDSSSGGSLAAVGTPEGQYKGKTVNGWYWDKPQLALQRADEQPNRMTARRRKTYI